MRSLSVTAVRRELVEYKRDMQSGTNVDVRLQYMDGSWRLWYGDSQYDADHRGCWGCGSIDKQTNCAELAKGLIGQVDDMMMGWWNLNGGYEMDYNEKPTTVEQARRLLGRLAKEAVEIQDACNMLGLSKHFPKVVQAVAECLKVLLAPEEYGTRQVNGHAIVRLWVSKLHDLAGMGLSDTEAYVQAYETCQGLVERTADV